MKSNYLHNLIFLSLVLCMTMITSCGSDSPKTYQEEDYKLSEDGTILEAWYLNTERLNLKEDPAFDGVTKIQAKAFMHGCQSLRSITLPKNLQVIGQNAFRGLRYLTDVAFPEGLQTIEEGAFIYCDGLTTLTLPNSITSIDSNAFAHCITLKTINIPEHLDVLKYNVFANTILQNVVVPSTIKRIETFAFFPTYGDFDTVIEINPHANLEIESNAFGNIFNHLIYRRIKINSEIPPQNIADMADSYEGSSLITFYVPDTALKTYRADTNWKKLTIKGFSFLH